MATPAPKKSPTQKKAESDAIFLFWGVSNTIAFLHNLLTGSKAGVFAKAYPLSFFLGSLSISVAFVFLFGSFATDSMDMKSVCLAFLKGSFIIFFLGSLSISVAFVFLFGSFATDSMDMKSVCLAFLKGSFIILIVTGIGLSVWSWLA